MNFASDVRQNEEFWGKEGVKKFRILCINGNHSNQVTINFKEGARFKPINDCLN